MLIEEEEPKTTEVNTDALEAVFEEVEIDVFEEILPYDEKGDEEKDEIDIAFAANDEGYW